MLTRLARSALCLVAMTAIHGQTAPPAAWATRTPAPPKIDAVLNEPAWQTAAEVRGFVLASAGQPATQQTTVRVLFDDQALYFGFTCLEAKMGEVAAS